VCCGAFFGFNVSLKIRRRLFALTGSTRFKQKTAISSNDVKARRRPGSYMNDRWASRRTTSRIINAMRIMKEKV
jgi:hypothetical protein